MEPEREEVKKEIGGRKLRQRQRKFCKRKWLRAWTMERKRNLAEPGVLEDEKQRV